MELAGESKFQEGRHWATHLTCFPGAAQSWGINGRRVEWLSLWTSQPEVTGQVENGTECLRANSRVSKRKD